MLQTSGGGGGGDTPTSDGGGGSTAVAAAAASRFFPSMQPEPATPSPRELQVVWQGRWPQRDESAMEVDSDGASSRSREYQLTASSLAELTSLVRTYFPVDSSRALVLTDEEQKPLSPHNFRELADRDVVLVFEPEAGQSVGELSINFQWSKAFQHIPHPSIVTYSQELIGAPEQHAIVYALAEFCDNSISALRKYRAETEPNHEGHIRLIFMRHASSSASGKARYTVAIEDDGCGMTRETLEAFSRMGDAPQYRGEAREAVEPDADNHYLNVNISQWGIGAKSAGFFIGDNIIVSSRARAVPRQVLECEMSQKRMFQEHKRTGNAFQDDLSRRAVGDPSSYPYPKHERHPYLDHLIRAEADQLHFTRIVVTGVEDRHVAKLEAMVPRATDPSLKDGAMQDDEQPMLPAIALELANIYNRFLHGPMGRETPGVSNSGKHWLRPNITVQHVVEANPNSTVDGFPFIVHSTDLVDVIENDASQFQLLKRGPVFRFEMVIHAPPTDTHSTEVASNSAFAHVRGEIYYLPRSVDGETHPELRRKKQLALEAGDEEDRPIPSRGAARAAAAAAAPSSAGSAVTAVAKPKLDADGNLVLEEDSETTFDVYWHGRLIPLSHVRRLGFMKFAPEYKDCIPRLKGALFFSFPFLTSRNKLTFAERNLQSFLDDKANHHKDGYLNPVDEHGRVLSRVTTAMRVPNRWTETLKAWKGLDANYEWQQQYYLRAESARERCELYSQVTIKGTFSEDFQVLKRGKLYKLLKAGTKKCEWVEAVAFEKESAPTSASDGASEYGGSGKIRGHLMPKEAQLGASTIIKSLRLIDKSTSMAKQAREYERFRSETMSNEPHRITVWMEPCTKLETNTIFRKTAGWSFPGTAVALVGHKHNGIKKTIVGEFTECEIRHFTKEFAGAASNARTKKEAGTAARPTKRSKRTQDDEVIDMSDEDDRPLARNRTARPKQVRRAGGAASVAEEARKSNSDEDDEKDGETVPFRGSARVMSAQAATSVAGGGKVSMDTPAAAAPSAAAASAAIATKKRKAAAAASEASELGRSGFYDYLFPELGRYQITFGLVSWTSKEGQFFDRSNVLKVKCDVIITPALPATVTAVDPAVDFNLGKSEDTGAVGFQLTDSFKNEWDHASLRGDTSTCGIRISHMETSLPVVIATAQPLLQWDARKKHWAVRDLTLTLAQDADRGALGLKHATDHVEVLVKFKFDVNDSAINGINGYTFDPPPKAEALAKLRSVVATVRVRLGPGVATQFIYNIPSCVEVDNAASVGDLSMHLVDTWHHCTGGSNMEIGLSALVPFLPRTSFTTDHDVLTRTGWRLIHQVQVGEHVWSLRDPATADVRQGWATVLTVESDPAPTSLWAIQDSKHYNLLISNSQTIGAEAATEVARGSTHTMVHRLTTTGGNNFYVRRHDNRRIWSPIFTGPHDVASMPFPLPSMPGVKHYDVDPMGQVHFQAIPVHLSPSVFASHCVELVEGAPVVEFDLLVQLRYKDADDPQLIPLSSCKITVKPRWGPVQLLLLKDASHLDRMHEKVTPEMLQPLQLSGAAGAEVPSLYVGFLHESGRLMPVAELQEGVSFRQRHMHFYIDGLDGAANHFTLGDLDADGHIKSGLNFPTILAASSASSPTGAKTPSQEDGSPRTFSCTLRMAVEEPATPPAEAAADAAIPAEPTGEDTAMVDVEVARATSRESKPKLSSLIPFSALRTAFSARVSPGPPAHWTVATSFPRGFKCGLIFGEHVQMCLVDQYGNRTAIPADSSDQKIELDLQIFTELPGSTPPPTIQTDPPAVASAPMDVDGPASSTNGAAAAATPASSAAVSSPVAGASSAAAATGGEAIITRIANLGPTRPMLADGRTQASYFVNPAAFLVASAGTYWLVARDKSGVYAPSPAVQVQIVPGNPHTIRAFTREDCSPASEVGYLTPDPTAKDPIREAERQAEAAARANRIHTTSKGHIGRLWVKFFDRGGNETVSTNTAQLQLVLPNRPAPAAAAGLSSNLGSDAAAAPAKDESEPRDSLMSAHLGLEDKTVSGVYAYPLARIKPAAATTTPAVKDEFAPIDRLVGSAMKLTEDPAQPRSYVLLEEWTLHLNTRDMVGSSLLIQAREPPKLGNAAAAAASAKKKPAKAVKRDIIIDLEVKPFVQAIDAIHIASVYDPSLISTALAVGQSDLSLKSRLLAPPTVHDGIAPAAAAASSAATSTSASLTPVPCGTPFPSISVSMDGLLSPTSGPKPSTDSTTVKKEHADDVSVHAGFLLSGLSLAVYHMPNGVQDSAQRRAVKDLYKPARFDVHTQRFVFEPIRPDTLQALQPAAAANDDYVFNSVGDWLFLVRYLEPREVVANVLLPAECERIAQMTQAVVAGQPKRMEIVLSEQRTSGDIVVGNMERSAALAAASAAGSFQARGTRTIASNLRLKLYDQAGQLVRLDTLSDDSIAALKAVQWKVHGIAERPLPAATIAAVAAAAAPAPAPAPVAPPTPSSSGRDAIIIIDSDEDEPMEEAPAPAPPAPAAPVVPTPSLAAFTAVPAPATPPQLMVSPPVLDLATNSIVFSEVSIVAQSSGESGKYVLHFSLPPPFTATASLNFYFSNDQAAMEQHVAKAQARKTIEQGVIKRHEAKLAEVVSMQQLLAALDEENRRLQDRERKLQDELVAWHTKLEQAGLPVPISHLMSVTSFLTELTRQQDRLRRMQQVERTVSVPLKLPIPRNPPPRLTQADGFHGQIAQLATISEPKLCALISWHMQNSLTTFVTTDRNCRGSREIRQWCQAQREGQVLDLAGVSRSNFDPKTLPHQYIRNPSPGYTPPGNPRYLVNCLEFSSRMDPSLQLQYFAVFQSLSGKTLILDSMDEAVAYRAHLLKHGQQCPTMLVMRECKALSANNIERFDNNAFARGLDSERAHFAVVPSSSGAESTKKVAQELHAQATEITAALAHLPSLEPEQRNIAIDSTRLNFVVASQNLQTRLAERQIELRAIRNELQELGINPSSVPGTRLSTLASPSGPSSLHEQNRLNDQERRRAQAAALMQRNQQDRELQQQRSAMATAGQHPNDQPHAAAARSSAPRGVAIRGGKR